MKEYTKPVVEVTSEVAEGVYAASGAPKCDSKYMNGVVQHPTYGWTSGSVSVRVAYGCSGCPAYRNGICALSSDYIDAGMAGSYDTDAGNRMPEWEAAGHTENTIITDEIWNDLEKNYYYGTMDKSL